ncbi:hypothetical protein HPB51_025150 [Rhipicephalus microplus]|uniref:Tick transposon n=1 Tax=Rhipicephalus microplus TaxID=6941 RepID=A0A9J6ED53_RHIMP|nr:hypothetical protein HPB51_025150 [Rhipicephalus microplus]
MINNRRCGLDSMADDVHNTAKTEVEWQSCLRQLRSRLAKKVPEHLNRVHVTKQVNLQGNSHDALSFGPKFAVETKTEELLAFVRQLSKYATEETVPPLISEGVDVVARSKVARLKFSVKRVADYLMDNSLCVLPAAREVASECFLRGCFVKKPALSLAKSFKWCDEDLLRKLKSSVFKLCKNINLGKLEEYL